MSKQPEQSTNAYRRKDASAVKPSAGKHGAADVFETIKAYARQELLDPLSGVPRWLALGLLGSVFVVTGIVMLLLALLRGLQTETGAAFSGNLSWAPYVIAMIATLLVTVVILRQITKRRLS